MRGASAWSVLWTGLTLCAASAAFGQRASPVQSTVQPPQRDPAPEVQEVGPSLRLLRSDKGELQQVPNLTLNELEKLWLWKQRIAAPEPVPTATLMAVRIDAAEQGPDLMDVKVQLTVRLTATAWQSVTLGMAEVAWLGAPKSPSAESFLDRDAGGYALWMRAQKIEQRHDVVLEGQVRRAELAGVARLELSLPRAGVSELRLPLPNPEHVARLVSGVGKLSREHHADNWEAVVRGAEGHVELAWGPTAYLAASPVLEAVGQVRITPNETSLRSEARLMLRNFRGPLGKVRVRLPAGSQWIPREASTYQVARVPDSATEGTSEPPTVEVVPRDPLAEQLEIVLVAEQPRPAYGETIRLSGFSAVGAVRQVGHVTLVVDGDWEPHWGPLEGASRVAEIPGSDPVSTPIVAFEYSAHPFSIPLTITRRETRLSVEPSYEVHVEARRMVCVGRWKYRAEGAKLHELRYDPADWDMEDWGPPERIAEEIPATSESTDRVLRLAQPAAGDFEVGFRASRELPVEGGPLVVQLPRPYADQVKDAEVLLTTSDNCSLIPEASIANSETHWAVVTGSVATSGQPPLRTRIADLNQPLALRRVVHPGELRAAGHATVAFDSGGLIVEQRLRFSLRYERRSSLPLVVPKELARAGGPEVSLEGARLSLVLEPATESSADGLTVHVLLPEPSIGTIELVVRTPMERLDAQRPHGPRSLPLVTAATEAWDGQQLTVMQSVDSTAQPTSAEDWKAIEGAVPEALAWSTTARPTQLSLAVQTARPEWNPSTVVHQAWIQIQQTQGVRQVRAVFRLVSRRDGLRFGLPPTLSPGTLQAWCDGQIVVPQTREGRFEVTWANSTTSTHVIELQYRVALSDADSALGSVAPALLESVLVEQSMWQFEWPTPQRVVSASPGLTAEEQWNWSSFGFERQPRWDSSALETWCGATQAATLPPSASRHLYSALGYPRDTHVRTVSRTWQLFVASLATMGLGIGWRTLRTHRRTLAWFALMIAIACGMAFPAASLEWAQAGALGAALVGVAALLQRDQSRRSPAARLGSGSSVVRSSSSSRRIVIGTPTGDVVPETAGLPERQE